jgi:hypothetical protein
VEPEGVAVGSDRLRRGRPPNGQRRGVAARWSTGQRRDGIREGDRGYLFRPSDTSTKVGPHYALDAEKDLRPVCANCHAMLHTTYPVLTIGELHRRARVDG